jgi:uncharacterized Tic20 family protein
MAETTKKPAPKKDSSNAEKQAPTKKNKGDENMWAMFCHLGALLGLIIPLGNIIVPFIIWMIYRDQYPLVMEQGKESLNFQISVTIYAICFAILIFIAIGVFLLIGLGIFVIIQIIIATVKVSNGEKYQYPLSIKFIK